MPVNLKAAVNLIKLFEGYRSKAYLCPAGVWTIGHGTTRYPDGFKVMPGDTCTEEEAEAYLAYDVKEYAAHVKSVVEVRINNNEFCALTSFCYNVGMGNLSRSTLLRLLNAGTPRIEVAEQFARWNRGGGKVLRGLVRRRKAEKELFLRPVGAIKRLA
ncbi:MAG: lysozyme [Bdellovibrionales bacterium]